MARERFDRQQAQFDRLVRVGLRHTTTFLWFTKSATAPPRGMSGASIILANLGSGALGITAAHVFLPYATAKRENPKLVCHVGGRVLYLEERVIDCNEHLDVATFRLTADEVSAGDVVKETHIPPCGWPVADPEVGEPVLACGFRGQDRELESGDDLVTGFGAILVQVKSVNSRQLVCQFDYDQQIPCAKLDFQLTPQTDLGGLSGGPIWRQAPNDPNHLELVGVVSEYNAALGLLFATRANFISPDGKIHPPLVE